MDIDRFVVANTGMWARLDELSVKARKARGTMEAGEVDELVALYQRTSAQLSHARGYFDDPGLTARLSTLVASANAAIYGVHRVAGRSVRSFFTETFPAAVYVSRRFIAVAVALLLVPAIAVGAWVATSPEALRVAVPEETQQALLESRFEDYYSSKPAAQFSTQVQINNIQVSFLAFALGIAGGVLTAALLIFNGVNVGVAGGLFWQAGEAGKFFGLILPHGLLELTSIAIAGAAGLRLAWALIAPGDRRRGEAIAEEGRRSIVIIIGLMLCFLVAGFIEAFVTPSGLPTAARVGLGVLVEVGFVAWIVGQGRPAIAAGLTGLFGEGG
ncbi:MAG: stage II sporulation protein M [Acidimicrobiales bacterium]